MKIGTAVPTTLDETEFTGQVQLMDLAASMQFDL